MSDFSLSFKKFTDKAIKINERIIRKTAFDVTSSFIMDTPVLTGHLRGDWRVSIDEESNEVLNVSDKTGRVTKAKAKAALERPIGKYIFIQNNQDYAAEMEYYEVTGGSLKAPKGFVRINLLRFSKFLNDNARSEKV
jgi:hypothetical protein